MYQIQNLTADSRQRQTLALPDGSLITIAIYFVPMQLGWFITEFTYKDFTVNGLRITNSPDILYQWRNKLPFGLACFSAQNNEPTQQQDFLAGTSRLYILTADEVNLYTGYLSGQV